MYSDLIFDFDGTLSDTYPVATKALLEILKENGIDESFDVAYAKLKISYGHAVGSYCLPFSKEEARRVLFSRAEALGATEQKPIDGACALLKAAAQKGCRCFVYTHSGPFVKTLLDKWGVSDCIAFVLDSSFGFPLKPAPDALLYLIDRFGIDKKSALMVGDRDIDIDVGHNAGIDSCLFDVGGFYPDCKAEHSVRHLLDIQKLI